jgi:hypothetical protein
MDFHFSPSNFFNGLGYYRVHPARKYMRSHCSWEGLKWWDAVHSQRQCTLLQKALVILDKWRGQGLREACHGCRPLLAGHQHRQGLGSGIWARD